MKRNILFLLIAVSLCFPISCKKEPPVSTNEVQAIHQDRVASKLDDKIWKEAPVHPAKLIVQDMVEPRLLRASTLQVNVQAVTDGRQVAFRLQWDDETADDLAGVARFADACAIQLPAKVEADLPAPQMGEEGRPVEITYWSASWQASVDGRPDRIEAIYPRAAVDHYPFQAPALKAGSQEQKEMAQRYAPARRLGNLMAGPRKQPVQDLIAEGPGALRPAERSVSTGTGARTEKGWNVLILRPLPEGFKTVSRGQVAFAVWEGSKQEVGSRKMRSVWIPFVLGEAK